MTIKSLVLTIAILVGACTGTAWAQLDPPFGSFQVAVTTSDGSTSLASRNFDVCNFGPGNVTVECTGTALSATKGLIRANQCKSFEDLKEACGNFRYIGSAAATIDVYWQR